MSPLIEYQSIRFTSRSLETIEKANEIIAEFQAQGFDLTLRQLFYQFVSRDLLPNTQRDYKNLGGVINDARLAGMIDWDSIVDRTRNLRSLAHWDSPASIVEACAQQFRRDLWESQPSYVEVWIEKDALVGVIEGVCHDFDVPHFSCRGYTSQSEMWSAAQRLIAVEDKSRLILHLGDHDPSGMDMTRDIEERLRLFGADVEVDRLALNPDQVRTYKPPPNPAKITDSRATAYIERFGRDSWELDALDPNVIVGLIRDAIEAVLDRDEWDAALAHQQQARDQLAAIAGRWADVVKIAEKRGPKS